MDFHYSLFFLVTTILFYIFYKYFYFDYNGWHNNIIVNDITVRTVFFLIFNYLLPENTGPVIGGNNKHVTDG